MARVLHTLLLICLFILSIAAGLSGVALTFIEIEHYFFSILDHEFNWINLVGLPLAFVCISATLYHRKSHFLLHSSIFDVQEEALDLDESMPVVVKKKRPSAILMVCGFILGIFLMLSAIGNIIVVRYEGAGLFMMFVILLCLYAGGALLIYGYRFHRAWGRVRLK